MITIIFAIFLLIITISLLIDWAYKKYWSIPKYFSDTYIETTRKKWLLVIALLIIHGLLYLSTIQALCITQQHNTKFPLTSEFFTAILRLLLAEFILCYFAYIKRGTKFIIFMSITTLITLPVYPLIEHPLNILNIWNNSYIIIRLFFSIYSFKLFKANIAYRKKGYPIIRTRNILCKGKKFLKQFVWPSTT
jgi:hypothetical protein